MECIFHCVVQTIFVFIPVLVANREDPDEEIQNYFYFCNSNCNRLCSWRYYIMLIKNIWWHYFNCLLQPKTSAYNFHWIFILKLLMWLKYFEVTVNTKTSSFVKTKLVDIALVIVIFVGDCDCKILLILSIQTNRFIILIFLGNCYCKHLFIWADNNLAFHCFT